MTTALDFIIKQTITRKSEAMGALVNNVDRDELSEGELLHLWQKLTVASEAGIRIWNTLDDKAAVLEALERIEDYTAYANKMIALHGKGEAAEKAKRRKRRNDTSNIAKAGSNQRPRERKTNIQQRKTMEALILERLEEGIDAFFVEAMDEFQKIRDEIHLDEEKAKQLEVKESDCTEAIRELKDLHYSGRWEKEQHRVVFYNGKIYEYSWFIKNLLVSNTPRSLKDGEIRRCAAIQAERTNALFKKIRVIDSFREVNLRIFLQSAFNRRVVIPVSLHLRSAIKMKNYDAAERYLHLIAPGLVFFEHLFADEETE